MLAEIVKRVAHKGNSWFEASAEQAVALFIHFLSPDAMQEISSSESTAIPEVVEPAVTPREPDAEEVDVKSDDEVWCHVAACSSVDAEKAIDIRAALEQKLGKVDAKRLLSRARPSVAKDATGKKNRVLRIGCSALKIKQ